MATIKEIAALAGVSRGTVDRVLNHRGGVNPQTAAKVQEIAQALDYRPNRAGLALAAQKHPQTLGVILFSRDNPFFADVLQAVNAKAQELAAYGCQVLIRQISGEVQEQLEVMDQLAAVPVSGIAMVPCNHSAVRRRINQLWDAGIPVVTLNTDIENSRRLAYVGSHYTRSGQTAAGLMCLMAREPVRAGIVTGFPHILCHTQRIAGFSQALKERDPQGRIVASVENQDDEIESYRQTMAMLTEHPEINALFFAAGGVYGGCRGLQDLGLAGRIPVVAFDQVPTTRDMILKGVVWAVICQQPHIQGSLPLEILFDYLTAGEIPKEYCYVQEDIRIRENLQV